MANTATAAQKIAQKKDAAELRERLRGLPAAAADDLRRAIQLQNAGDYLLAGQWLLLAAATAPNHPEVLRWRGIHQAGRGDWADAAASLAQSAATRPGDFKVLLLLAAAQDNMGDNNAALPTLQAAAASAVDAQDWLSLSLECDRQGHYDEALQAVQRLLAAQPGSPVGLLQRSRCLKAMGQADASAADCRSLIAQGQETARAWFSLVDLKTVPLTADELRKLEHAAAAPAVPADERLLLDFALGKALEDAGRHVDAFAALQRANRTAQAMHPWDATGSRQRAAAVRAAFTDGPAAQARPQGRELIFLVGLPRSGTTLVEQVLASHSSVEGASELPYLTMVIDAESRRRGQPFPAWVGDCTADDWTRLGQHYLQLSARWRRDKPISTDKLPNNWLLAGAVLAMLPDARIVDCRRDPVETCWSCYKQLFGPGHAGFSYDFADLADYWQDYDALTRFWAARSPQRFRTQQYEELVAQPEAQIRALLDFCGLPFEPQCLHFHTAQRAIRTPSALQVRQPLRKTSTPGAGYGALLDPLRQLLAQRAGDAG